MVQCSCSVLHLSLSGCFNRDLFAFVFRILGKANIRAKPANWPLDLVWNYPRHFWCQNKRCGVVQRYTNRVMMLVGVYFCDASFYKSCSLWVEYPTPFVWWELITDANTYRVRYVRWVSIRDAWLKQYKTPQSSFTGCRYCQHNLPYCTCEAEPLGKH